MKYGSFSRSRQQGPVRVKYSVEMDIRVASPVGQHFQIAEELQGWLSVNKDGFEAILEQ
jgi:hypothetical protein